MDELIFTIEYRRERWGHWYRIRTKVNNRAIKGDWFQDCQIAHIRVKRVDYFAFSDWFANTKHLPINMVFSLDDTDLFTIVKEETEAERIREVRRNFFGRRKVK